MTVMEWMAQQMVRRPHAVQAAYDYRLRPGSACNEVYGAILFAGQRVTVSQICDATGYSRQLVWGSIKRLRELQMVESTRPGQRGGQQESLFWVDGD